MLAQRIDQFGHMQMGTCPHVIQRIAPCHVRSSFPAQVCKLMQYGEAHRS